MEDHDAMGLLQRWFEAGVEVLRRTPVLKGQQERGDHVGLHRTGAEQRDVDDEVLEGLRPELADQLALAGTLDLEAPQCVCGADQPERPVILEADPRPVVEVDVDVVDPLHLLDCVRHCRLHADAKDVELEQAQGLDVILVELAHREPQPAGLDRGAIEQLPVGQDHAAGMHGDVPGQAIEAFHEVEENSQARNIQATGTQLGQLGQGGPDITGPNVRKRLGDGIDLAHWQPERGADIPDRVAHAVGVHHRHTGDPVPAETFQHVLVDLGPSGGLHIDVDVGQLGAKRRAEPLHEQSVTQRLHPADAEQVVDHAAGPRTSCRHPHPEVTDQVTHRRHRHEVGRVAEPGDHLKLVLQSRGHRRQLGVAGSPISRGNGTPTAGSQNLLRALVRGNTKGRRLWQVHRAEAQIGARVQRAGLRQSHGVGHQLTGPVTFTADATTDPGTEGPSDVTGYGIHLGRRGEMACRGHPVEMTRVQ